MLLILILNISIYFIRQISPILPHESNYLSQNHNVIYNLNNFQVTTSIKFNTNIGTICYNLNKVKEKLWKIVLANF